MILRSSAREYYSLAITTSPAVTGDWEASFDGGVTWLTGTEATVGAVDVVRWLLAGPTADVGTAVATITENVAPLIRVTESPEIVVCDAPPIVLQ